jgi:hypothetical protein
MHLHPAVDSAELRSLATDDWEARVDDHRMICEENWVAESVAAAGATLIGYRPLRELARAGEVAACPPTTIRQRHAPGRTGATVATIVSSAVVATAVALLLAQSAGAIHLGFLGPVAWCGVG